MKYIFFSYLAIFFLNVGVTASLTGQAWIKLGSAKVHGHLDHDDIWVTGLKGDFSAIKLFVENGSIQFERVVVHFTNGGKEEMLIRNFIKAGGETRVLDLPGGDRVIRKVDIYYKSNAKTKKKAKVVLYGRR